MVNLPGYSPDATPTRLSGAQMGERWSRRTAGLCLGSRRNSGVSTGEGRQIPGRAGKSRKDEVRRRCRTVAAMMSKGRNTQRREISTAPDSQHPANPTSHLGFGLAPYLKAIDQVRKLKSLTPVAGAALPWMQTAAHIHMTSQERRVSYAAAETLNEVRSRTPHGPHPLCHGQLWVDAAVGKTQPSSVNISTPPVQQPAPATLMKQKPSFKNAGRPGTPPDAQRRPSHRQSTAGRRWPKPATPSGPNTPPPRPQR